MKIHSCDGNRCTNRPEAGEKELITGGGNQLNPAKLELPPGADTTTLPDPPPATIAVILTDELIVNDCTGIPPTLTVVTSLNEVPFTIDS